MSLTPNPMMIALALASNLAGMIGCYALSGAITGMSLPGCSTAAIARSNASMSVLLAMFAVAPK
ncbi:hypothetical protein V5R04_01765 [Jonesiaceae bacterium BS-20]|uniref:Uncharacterized protein n=1 Tax=Jonesiaceae bacterium BS-20 TaxID=3120821 RepID=A0AAU7DXI7_9MICO